MKRVVLCLLVIALLCPAFPPPPAQAFDRAVVCLDPGHGGLDGGAAYQFSNGKVLKESEINLDIALAVKTLLEQSGQRAVMTRTDDDTRLSTRERYPLANAADAAVLVAIHTNSIASDEPATIDGACTLYQKESDKALAEMLQAALYPALRSGAPRPGIFRNLGVRPFRSRIMRRSYMPAVIVEPVFMSQPEEAALLARAIQRDASGGVLRNTRRAEIAYAVYEGIVAYLASPIRAQEEARRTGRPHWLGT